MGVSGGKDSIWQACILRDDFGLNPLLVQFASAEGTTLGRINAEVMVNLGFSLHSVQPNPKIARLLAKKSFFEYGNIAKYSEFALFTAPSCSTRFPIFLWFFGETLLSRWVTLTLILPDGMEDTSITLRRSRIKNLV